MDYALDLFLPILGGLFLGNWLHTQWGQSSLWTVLLAILGLFLGLGVAYRRFNRQPPTKK